MLQAADEPASASKESSQQILFKNVGIAIPTSMIPRRACSSNICARGRGTCEDFLVHKSQLHPLSDQVAQPLLDPCDVYVVQI